MPVHTNGSLKATKPKKKKTLKSDFTVVYKIK